MEGFTLELLGVNTTGRLEALESDSMLGDSFDTFIQVVELK